MHPPSPPGARSAGQWFARATQSPLVRGGLVLAAGVLAGNLSGFVRVALMAYLLGTHSSADALAVALGPLDSLNSLFINSMLFAFVPVLAAVEGTQRVRLFRRLNRVFGWVFVITAAGVMAGAPWLMKLLAPGLDPRYFPTAVNLARILALSAPAAGASAMYAALLYTDRRFGPAAFHQVALNLGAILCALTLWKMAGVYAFAIGYTVGAWAQLGIVYWATRRERQAAGGEAIDVPVRGILARPAFFMVYAGMLALNLIFTRAWATHGGPGMAAAFDYCMRGVGVPVAILVSPISSSLLPEIARLRSLGKLREALRLIDRTLALVALAAVGGCVFALALRTPAIALVFQRGSFTPESTRLVAAVFLGLGPSLIGWSLMEIMARALFSLDRPWPAVLASGVPVMLNMVFMLRLGSARPELLGVGATLGFAAGFAVLFAIAHVWRRRRVDA